jgi:hypothetical protein
VHHFNYGSLAGEASLQGAKGALMRKTSVLALALLLSASWLLAQDNMGKSAGSATTIQGCVSNANGQYWLTDSSGKKYQLSSHANVLKNHIGHEVAIAGGPAVKTIDTTVQGSESTAKEIFVFRVKTVKHVADTCKAM